MDTTVDPSQEKTRTIVLIYGSLDNGAPFWVYAAVRPSKYQDMLTAQKTTGLDLHHFEEYGEIIVSGEGPTPPDSVTLSVAEMYQTAPAAAEPAEE
jgi:hypothetical protein